MVNILLEGFDIDALYLRSELSKYIKAGCKVAVVAFSFKDNQANCAADWDTLYSKEMGKYYSNIVTGFTSYGLTEADIYFINYFRDTKVSAAQKIKQAHIVFFTGGLPDKMMNRIDEFGLRKILLQHRGIIMGYSAGAVIQLAEYYLSPDDDYKEFSYYEGLPYLDSFYLEVHYEGTNVQDQAIQKVLQERKKTVYATALNKGAIIVDCNVIKILGDVKTFTP